MRAVLLILIIFNFSGLVKGQDFTIQNYTDESGLPQNSVKSIATDNAGYMWLATENGLVRYDGQEFLVFDKNLSGATSNRIITFKKDLDADRLFALTDKWQLIEIKNGKVVGRAIPYKQIYKFENTTRFSHYFSSGLPNILDSYFSNYPYLIQAKKNCLYKIDHGKISFYEQKKLLWSTAFSYQSNWRFVVMGTELFYIDEKLVISKITRTGSRSIPLNGDLTQRQNSLAGKPFWNVSTGEVFINIDSSLYELNFDSKYDRVRSELIAKDIDLTKVGGLSVVRDKKVGDIYVGTFTKGLLVYKKKQIKAIKGSGNGNQSIFYAQLSFKNNSVLYANGEIFENGSVKRQIPLIEKNSIPFSLASDGKDGLWTLKKKKLYHFDQDLAHITATYSFPTDLKVVYADQQHRIWTGNSSGVYLFNNTANKFNAIAALTRIKDVNFLTKVGDTLWIANASGLNSYNLKTEKVSALKPMENKTIRSLYARKNELWITTYGDGFYLLRNGKLTRLPSDKNNYLSTPHCILEDKKGYFWISTNKGLFKVAVKDLLNYVDEKASQVFYLYYDKSAGFNTNEFNGGCQPCATELRNGEFSFPSMNGITLFNPYDVSNLQPDLPIFVDKITVNNKYLNTALHEFKIPLNFNGLNIYVSSPYFGNKENLIFEYKIDDKEGDWNRINERVISLSYLSSGTHKLSIRKLNGFGINNYSYKDITFVLPYPFYQTWWFILAVLGLICLIIYASIKVRTKIIVQRNEQLQKAIDENTIELKSVIDAYEFSRKNLDQQNYFQNRFLAAIAHDIKSPLKYLMMTGESLYYEKTPDVDREGLRAIYKSSAQIYHFTENLLEYAKAFTNKDLHSTQNFNLHELVNEKTEIFSPIANSLQSQIVNNVDHNIVINCNKQLLSVILHNLLDNAVKFTPKGVITFSYTPLIDGYMIAVKDTGIGMDRSQLAFCNEDISQDYLNTSNLKSPSVSGLGVIMVKELAVVIKGDLKVSSIKGQGTTFEISFQN